MPINRFALIRYHALDQCFRNTGRVYFIEDLIEACSKALFEYAFVEEGVKKRQIFNDISFMESEQGWSIPLERIKEGKRVYYRYSDPNFSIKNEPLSEIEAIQLKEAMMIFERFKGMPQFEWMEELTVRLNTSFNLNIKNLAIISFEYNPYLKGSNYLSELYNAIVYKQTLLIEYKSFTKSHPQEILFSPYFLKEYNNRWFLFGFNHKFKDISNIAIDRIISINRNNETYIENTLIDFDEYFEDIIGVTMHKNTTTQRIVIKINNSRWPYIESKPLHGSQKVLKKTDECTEIELELIINKELVTLLFSYGPDIKIIEPTDLAKEIAIKAQSLINQYSI